jgi:hypothetical protein
MRHPLTIIAACLLMSTYLLLLLLLLPPLLMHSSITLFTATLHAPATHHFCGLYVDEPFISWQQLLAWQHGHLG